MRTSPSTAWARSGSSPFRCYAAYVQLQFLKGTSLDPVPPKASKHDEVRYLDVHEDDELDERLLRSWVEQSAQLAAG